jgi:hypothetical protein
VDVRLTRWRRRLDLEPALALLTVAICGSLSLLAYSDASALGRDVRRQASGSYHWTALEKSPDSGDADDDGDDGDDCDGAADVPAGATRLMADGRDAGTLVETASDVPQALRSVGWSLRGPPSLSQREFPRPADHHIDDCTSESSVWTAAQPRTDPDNSPDFNRDLDDRDVDDDDDHAGESFAASSSASARGYTATLILSQFDRLFFASDGHSLRAPPL